MIGNAYPLVELRARIDFERFTLGDKNGNLRARSLAQRVQDAE